MSVTLHIGFENGVPVIRNNFPTDSTPDYSEAPPELHAALINQESGGNPNAVSPVGAFGIGQTMPKTVERPGFGIPPIDPAKPRLAESERIGKAYLNKMYQKYQGNVDYALAAYNWGPANVDSWIAKGANPAALPAETRNYVASIKAQVAKGKGIQPSTPPPAPPTMATVPGASKVKASTTPAVKTSPEAKSTFSASFGKKNLTSNNGKTEAEKAANSLNLGDIFKGFGSAATAPSGAPIDIATPQIQPIDILSRFGGKYG